MRTTSARDTGDHKRRKMCIVATVPLPLNLFMRQHVAALAESYDVTLICNGRPEDVGALIGPNVHFIDVKFERNIKLLRDFLSLISLYRVLRREKFDCVFSIMPKTGLLAAIASRGAGIHNRFHMFTGQVWATKKGFRRWLLKVIDRFIASSATRVLADSPSQRAFLIDEKVVSPERIDVLGDGSISGVNLDRFRPNAEKRALIRRQLSVPENAIAFLFLGRITREKGILDLAEAFALIAEESPDAYLMIVGPDEDGSIGRVPRALGQHVKRVLRVDFTDRPEHFMAAADVFCLPSYREGFGTVIIEAAAAGTPSIGSKIYGIIDSIEDEKTGLLHSPRDVGEIVQSMKRLIDDPDLRTELATAGRERVIRKFDSNYVTELLVAYCKKHVPPNDDLSTNHS